MTRYCCDWAHCVGQAALQPAGASWRCAPVLGSLAAHLVLMADPDSRQVYMCEQGEAPPLSRQLCAQAVLSAAQQLQQGVQHEADNILCRQHCGHLVARA